MRLSIRRASRAVSFLVLATLFSLGFQNCSPVKFNANVEPQLAQGVEQVETEGSPTPAPTATPEITPTPTPEASVTPTPSPTSTPSPTPGAVGCELEKKQEGETWMAAAGQVREPVECTVGTGTQFQVFDLEKEYICQNGAASETGKVVKTPAGLEGQCNLDCGSNKNGSLWWNDLGTSVETLQCATSTTATAQVTYKNEAEYQCVNAVASATGNTRKTKLNETDCPPLTFNDQDNQATLAYEDIYPTPLDSDYNDFVTNIKVIETYSSLGELNKIVVEYAAKHIGGGLPHKLVMVFDGIVRGRDGWISNQNSKTSEPMFQGPANIKYELFDGAQNLLGSNPAVPKDQDLIVFESTKIAAENHYLARITITGINGQQNLLSVRHGLSIKRYRSLLYVPDSGKYSNVKTYDIDISDINPTAFDQSGRPLAFFVPVNWLAPKEGTSITKAYPDFQAHADYLKNSITNPSLVESDKAKNWFNNVILNYVDQSQP